MGNLFGGGKNNAASQARQQEIQRQEGITRGLSQINSIYGGGSYGTNTVQRGQFKLQQGAGGAWPNMLAGDLSQYYLANGTKLSDLTNKDPQYADWLSRTRALQGSSHMPPMPDPHTEGVFGAIFGPGGNVNPAMTQNQALRTYARHLALTGGLYNSAATAPGFNNDFYNQKQQAYIGYALPQVASQYNQMNQNTAFNLANRGLSQSSAGNMLRGSLEKERQLQTQGVGDAAIQQTNQLRQDVENQRSLLVSQLYASGDPNTSMQGALNTAANFQTPNTYQPLGNMFSNWANMYLAKQYLGAPQTPGGGMGGYNPYGMTIPGAFGQQQMMPNIVGSSSSIVR